MGGESPGIKRLIFKTVLLTVFRTSLSLAGNSGHLTWVAAARAALPIPISVCNIFVCPNSGMGASVWDF